MCGPKFCSMNHSVKTREFTEQDAEEVLSKSAAAAKGEALPILR